MKAWALAELVGQRERSERPYLEFLRVESMSAGLYVLGVGEADGQSPHAEDEVYVILSGHSDFTAADETRTATTGDVIFVPAGVPHRFHAITAELVIAVVFAPPET
jgi:mannose-6-phosphate isomerase-like protein (cupin superfamily)